MRRSLFVTWALTRGIGLGGSAAAQDVVKVGIVMPITGGSAPVGRQIIDAAKLYVAQHGDTVAGKKIELIIKDDAGVPDNSKRLAQELVVNDKVNFLAAGLTPSAMSMAPIATEGKVPTVVMVSGTSVVTERSPYYVRTSFTLGQQSGIIADWAIKNGSKAVSVLSDWAPGAEAGKAFEQHFRKGGGQVLETLKVPLANPDFAPFLQRARDLHPDTLFVFVPAGQAGAFARQFAEARPRQVRHQAHRPGRHHRRRRPAEHRRLARRRRHRRHLFGGASFGAEQGIRCRLQEGQRRPSAELHVGRRL